jgi:hypothetical protein
MTQTIRAVELIATECNQHGPTKHCREVFRAAICDAGGNVLGHASTARGVDKVLNKFRAVNPHLKAVVIGDRVTEEAYLAGYTRDCGFVDPDTL